MDPANPQLARLRPSDWSAVLDDLARSMVAHAPGLDRLDADVGDGDTGTNLATTVTSIHRAVSTVPCATFAELVSTTAQGVIDGSVGRSGRLLGAALEGIGDVARNADVLDASAVAMALEAAAERVVAMSAESGFGGATHPEPPPLPGSMVSVAVAVAAAALVASDADGNLAEVVTAAVDAGLDALEQSPLDRPELAEAGVVDAGAAGYLVLLEALVGRVCGEEAQVESWVFPADDEVDHEPSRARYLVTMVLELDDSGHDRLTRVWSALGDDVEIEVIDGVPTASVRTDDIGAVFEASLSVGRPRDIRVLDAHQGGATCG